MGLRGQWISKYGKKRKGKRTKKEKKEQAKTDKRAMGGKTGS